MSATSPVPGTTNMADRIEDDEKRMEEPGSDANTMVEKTDTDGENEPELIAEAEEDQLAPDEYPKGIQFTFILISLILSIFMVALDLVFLPPVFLSTNRC